MMVRRIGALRLCLGAAALGGFIAFAAVPVATAQWLPPWRFVSPGEIEGGLEAQGYVLTGPLMRRPGVYLADVSAGPAGYQRLVIDARSGAILERFPAPGRIWGPAVAARSEKFGEPPSLGQAPGTKPKAKTASLERRPSPTKSGVANPPLPPPAPREAAKPAGPPAPEPAEKPNSDQPKTDSRPTEVENRPQAAAPAAPDSSAGVSEKPKVSVVPPALFE